MYFVFGSSSQFPQRTRANRLRFSYSRGVKQYAMLHSGGWHEAAAAWDTGFFAKDPKLKVTFIADDRHAKRRGRKAQPCTELQQLPMRRFFNPASSLAELRRGSAFAFLFPIPSYLSSRRRVMSCGTRIDGVAPPQFIAQICGLSWHLRILSQSAFGIASGRLH